MVDRSAGRRSYGPRPCRSSPTLGWLSACALLLGLSCQADEVKVGFGDRMPPYCLPQTESGIEVDIFREALAFRGHILKPVFYPLKRVAVAFKAKQIDAAMIDSGMDLRAYGGIYAQSAVIYDNVFITLADRHLKIAAPGDLRNLHVLAFPGALERYPIWLTPVKDAGNYTELNDQALQVLTLQQGRYDVVLSDRYIFRYFTLLLKQQQGNIKLTEEHPFTKPNGDFFQVIFRNPAVKQDFEAGLLHLKKTGRYQAIYDHYLK